MNPSRWIYIWWFLSLDLSEAFTAELLIPADFKDQSRNLLRELIRGKSLLENENLNVCDVGRIFRRFEHATPHLTEEIFEWGQYIYQHDGRDRAAEFFWSTMAPIYERQDPSGETWVHELFQAIRTQMQVGQSALQRKIQLLRASEHSDWDKNISQLAFSGIDAVLETIENVTSFNAFLEPWNTSTKGFSIQQLDRLYEIGTQQQLRRDEKGLPIPYPGSWTPATQRFLRANNSKRDETRDRN